MSVDVKASGPFFDAPRCSRTIGHMLAEAKQAVGDEGLLQWRLNLISSMREPTGVYESFMHSAWRGDDYVVNDGYDDTNELQYGPWLEGVGSRNAPVTSFAGYAAMGRAFRALAARVEAIVQPPVDKWMPELND